jgi:hypothetical protein
MPHHDTSVPEDRAANSCAIGTRVIRVISQAIFLWALYRDSTHCKELLEQVCC